MTLEAVEADFVLRRFEAAADGASGVLQEILVRWSAFLRAARPPRCRLQLHPCSCPACSCGRQRDPPAVPLLPGRRPARPRSR